MTIYHGPLQYFLETGIGPDLALQDKDHISVDSRGRTVWSYEGLRPIRRGDRLTIRDPSTNSVVFDRVVDNVSVHATPVGWTNRNWLQMFFDGWPATLDSASQ